MHPTKASNEIPKRESSFISFPPPWPLASSHAPPTSVMKPKTGCTQQHTTLTVLPDRGLWASSLALVKWRHQFNDSHLAMIFWNKLPPFLRLSVPNSSATSHLFPSSASLQHNTNSSSQALYPRPIPKTFPAPFCPLAAESPVASGGAQRSGKWARTLRHTKDE